MTQGIPVKSDVLTSYSHDIQDGNAGEARNKPAPSSVLVFCLICYSTLETEKMHSSVTLVDRHGPSLCYIPEDRNNLKTLLTKELITGNVI